MEEQIGDEGINEQAIFEVLSHEIRRHILRLLAQHSFLAYSDLKKELRLSTGVLYHHLQKLQRTNLVRQRTTKEYELTDQGYRLLEYLRTLEASNGDIDAFPMFMSSNFNAFLNKMPLSRIIQWNPLAVALTATLIVVMGIIVQSTQVNILFIGPYLLPSNEQSVFNISLQFLAFILVFVVMESVYHVFYRNPEPRREALFLCGFFVLPALSIMGMLFLWLVSLVVSALTEFLFWIIVALLHVLYFVALLDMLVNIKRTATDRAMLFVLGSFYLFLLIVHLLT